MAVHTAMLITTDVIINTAKLINTAMLARLGSFGPLLETSPGFSPEALQLLRFS